MNNSKYVVVIAARREYQTLARTLKSLSRQTLPPLDVIIINDGADPKTKNIVESFGYSAIDVKRKDFDATGTKIMPALLNIGLRRARKLKPSFVAIMGADHLIPKHYFEILINRMNEDEKIAIAGGVIAGEPIKSFMPRGSGRLVRAEWWGKYNLQYVVEHGWEPWLVYRALKDGYKVKVYYDLITYVTRKTNITPRKVYYYGKGDKFIGHSFPFTLGRAALFSSRRIKNGIYLLAGYLSEQKTCKDIKDIVRKEEKLTIRSSFRNTVKSLFKRRLLKKRQPTYYLV